MADYEISTKITADSSGFEKGIKDAQKQTTSFSKSIKETISGLSGGKGLSGSLAGVVGKLGLVGGAVAVASKAIKATTQAVKECTEEFRNYDSGQKVLQQTLKVTGAETWTNIEALNTMQDELSRATNYSGGEIQQLQTVLLGFKSIKGDVFDQTTDAILDMATVMGMDLTNATQAVAKALDDPIKGLGSLSRQGFVFSESQKLMIQNLVNAGKQAEAQKIILDELNTTYGGASRSAVDSSKQMKNAFADLKKEIGVLLENNIIGKIRSQLIGVIQAVTDGIKGLNKTIQEAREQGEYEKRKSRGETTQEDTLKYYEEERQKLEQLRDIYSEVLNNSENYSLQEVESARKAVESYTIQIAKLDNKYNVAKLAVQKAEEETAEIAKQNDLLEERREIEETVKGIKEDANKKLEEQERKWKAIFDVTGREVSLEEKLQFYQDNLIEAMAKSNDEISKGNQLYKDRMAVIMELTQKIQSQQGNALTTEQQYNMAMQDKKNKTSKVEETITNTTIEEDKKRWKDVKDTVSKITQKIISVASTVINVAKTITTKIKQVFSTLKNIFSTGFNALKRITELNIGDMIDAVLKFEDGVLTFFYEVLPKLPNFIGEVLGSISSMFNTLASYIQSIDLSKIISDMLFALSNNMGPLVDSFVNFLSVLVPQVIKGFSNWINGGGFSVFLNALLELQKGIEKVVTDNIDELVDTIIDGLPDLMDTIRESIVSASQTFSKLIGPLAKLVSEIIIQLIDVLTSQEVIDASIEAVGSLVEALIADFKFAEIIVSLIEGIIRIVLNTPRLLGSIVDGIFKGLVNKDWGQIGKKIGEAILNMFTFNVGQTKDRTADQTVLDILTGGLSSLIRGISGKAVGSNNVQSGLTLVGERGAELVDFKGGERIYTAQNTKAILSGASSGGNSFNVTFNNVQDTSAYTMIKQLKNYNRQMAINGVL